MAIPPDPPKALTAIPTLPAPASASFERVEYHPSPADGRAAAPADSTKSEVRSKYTLDTPDIVAIGILVLAVAAAFVAAVVALGFVFGKVNGADTVKIVGTCVGGSTISGIVAALVGRKSKPSRRNTP
ncbi:MAG TPA: hypothetical protein VNZ03_00500 [Terriglobales bacterium]|nr:hypothetical protein [Terriglobales bacterium]